MKDRFLIFDIPQIGEFRDGRTALVLDGKM